MVEVEHFAMSIVSIYLVHCMYRVRGNDRLVSRFYSLPYRIIESSITVSASLIVGWYSLCTRYEG